MLDGRSYFTYVFIFIWRTRNLEWENDFQKLKFYPTYPTSPS